MLVEGLVYFVSSLVTPPPFRPHLAEAVGYWARGRRQAKAWAHHTLRTRRLIERVVPNLPDLRTLVVLGSGPMFDLPLQTLVHRFDRIVLVDRTHLWMSQRTAGRYPNVEQVFADICPREGSTGLEFLDDIPAIDWIISLNVLTELAEQAEPGKERAVIDTHLDTLMKLPCWVSVLTDSDDRILAPGGRLVEAVDRLHGRRLPQPAARWQWEIAPEGEEGAQIGVRTMQFFPDWLRANLPEPAEPAQAPHEETPAKARA